ncbi:MAG: hypothetical protein F4X32_02570 [Candidatus Dadabacteria bacterium]|nr:hypothetical protein [Candidatus Dadabacteria bacterium]MYB26371.1 hypothetical protein [Candidatus Dadabacteria bacterium]
MSEYQYYEFQAVDRALSKEDMAQLRGISSRAQITATSFTNHYEWGDLKADPTDMMKRWFDLHLYLANWGSRRFMIKLPKKFVDRDRFKDFLPGMGWVTILDSGDNTIIDIGIDELPEDSYEWDDGSGWLASMASLRADLLSGDLRVLYLAWLIGVQWGTVSGDKVEPLPGIGKMNGGLEAFAGFFRIDPDLLQAASESGAVSETPELSPETFRAALDTVADEEKISWLYRLVQGDLRVAAEVKNRAERALSPSEDSDALTGLRTVSELRARASDVRKAREEAEARKREERRLESERREEKKRREHLGYLRLRGREKVWGDIEKEISRRDVSAYERAAALISDMRVIAEEDGALDAHSSRLDSLREKHKRKARFIEQLDRVCRG